MHARSERGGQSESTEFLTARTRIILVFAGAVVALIVALGQVAGLPFSHDEHQFVAAAELLRQGLLPYRDFPFHHLPNQIGMQAALMALVPGKLMAGRVASGLAGAIGLMAIALTVHTGLLDRPWRLRLPLALLSPALVISLPLFHYSSGRAWNHDLPLALALISTGLAMRCREYVLSSGRSLVIGLLIGLAAGTRATFILVIIPVGLGMLIWQRRLGSIPARNFLAVGLGVTFGLLPTLVFMALDPTGFWFGNVEYARLNTEYRLVLGQTFGIGLVGKWNHFGEVILGQPLHAVVLVLWIAQIIKRAASGVLRRRMPAFDAWAFVSFIAVSLIVGAWVPSPAWDQYYYAPMIFVLAAVVIGSAEWIDRLAGYAGRVVELAILFTTIGLVAVQLSRSLPIVLRPNSWVPTQSMALGRAIQQHVPNGTVLTLGPIFPLEGELNVVPALAMGPLTWRVTPLIDAETVSREQLISPTQVESLFEQQGIYAVLTNLESGNAGFTLDAPFELELPLDRAARAHGLRRIFIRTPIVSETLQLWVRP